MFREAGRTVPAEVHLGEVFSGEVVGPAAEEAEQRPAALSARRLGHARSQIEVVEVVGLERGFGSVDELVAVCLVVHTGEHLEIVSVDAVLVGRVEIIGVVLLDGRVFAQLVAEKSGRGRFHFAVGVRVGDVGRTERLFPLIALVAECPDDAPSLEGRYHASDRRGVLGLFQLGEGSALRYRSRHAVGRSRSRDLGGVYA